MQKISAVIFDLGDTLMYLDGDPEEIVRREAAELASFLNNSGLNVDRAAFSRVFLRQRTLFSGKAEKERVEYPATETLKKALAQFGYKNVDQELITEGVAVFFSCEERLWRAYPDACATLQRLSEADYLLGLVSNASDDGLIQRLVEGLDFRRWLGPVLSSAGVGIRKPDPKIFQMVLSQWGLPPQQAIMVGDRLEFDILGASLAGMHSVLVSKGEDPGETDRDCEITPDATIEQLSELPEVIARLEHCC